MTSLRWWKLAAMASAAAMVGTACSSRDMSPTESTGATSEAVTTCGTSSIGMPCAPSGSTSECDGVCTPSQGTFGVQVTCQKVDPKTNIGKICGTSNGTGCGAVCGDLGGDKVGCLSGVNAPDGAACRPSGGGFNTTVCDGECKAGACVARAARCGTFGSVNNNCGYNFCDTKNAASCILYASGAKGRQCSDSSTCTSADQCDGLGKCVGTAISCAVPTNPCLEPGTCNASTGKCDYVANTKPCTLGGDLCHAGVCAGGACTTGAAIDCDDKDICTTDSCDATVGCKHPPKCVAPDKCQAAACDATSGACSFTAVNCDDKNPCTTDSCDGATGCVHAAIPGCTYNPDAGVDTGVPPTDTGVPPTDTGVPPTDTGVPPTDTGVPPTDTGVPPTDTGVPPTDTGVEPTDTGVDPTDTGVDPTDTGTPTDASADGDLTDTGINELPALESSSCGCETPRSSAPTGAAAALGLGLVAALGRRRRNRK